MSKHPAFELAREIKEGNIPGNQPITETLEATKRALEQEAKSRGQGAPETKLATDAAQFLESTKTLIEEKNRGEVVQKFFLDAKEAATELSVQFQKLAQEGKLTYEGYGVTDIKRMQPQDWSRISTQSMETMRGFVLSLVDSQEFRSLLVQFVSLIQEVMNFESSKAPRLQISETGTQPLSQELKQKGEEAIEFGKSLASDIRQGTVPVSEEKKREVFTRFRMLLQRLSASDEYKRGVNGLFQIMDQVAYYSRMTVSQLEQQMPSTQTIQSQVPHLLKMWEDGKNFLAGFVGKDLIDRTIRDFRVAQDAFANDPQLYAYYAQVRSFLWKFLNEPQLLEKDDYYNQMNSLWEQGRQWINNPKYNTLYNILWDDFHTMGQRIKNDPVQSRLAKDATTLARDLVYDESGQPSLKIMTTGLSQFRSLLGPVLIQNLERLPIPTFSGSDETYDWTIENMILNGREIIPDKFDIKVWGAANVSLASTEAKSLTFITVWIRDMNIDIKDLKFHFIRKSFPKMDERGVADVSMAGKGSTIKLVYRIEGQQNVPWNISLYDINCNLVDLDVTVKESTHTWLMKMITSLWSGTIRRRIEYQVEQTLRESLLPINNKLNEVLRT